MITARSGGMKSTFALYWVQKMGLSCLYFSADMTPSQVSYKLAAATLQEDTEELEKEWSEDGEQERILDSLKDSRITFSYGGISYSKIDDTLDAYVEMHDAWPEVIVVDNLMDFEGAESDYSAQQEAMSFLHAMKSVTGSVVLVLHHSSDKSGGFDRDPYTPPARKEIKNGMSEKPEQILSVGYNPHKRMLMASVVKARMARSDVSANSYVELKVIPEQSRFERAGQVEHRPMYAAPSYMEGDEDGS